jgi:HAD superfamily hydrolase (TIGR01509 family)
LRLPKWTSMPLVHVFDLGRVLIWFDEELVYQRLRERCPPGAPVEAVFNAHLAAAAVDIGGDFDSLHPLLLRDLGLAMTLEELRLAWNDIFSPMPEMLAVVKETPRPRYLLSTTNEPHVSWLRERFGYVFELFDRCFLTCEIGLRKPDPALFRYVESVSGQPPQRHLLIDDLAENVAGAQAAGWQAIQFLGVEDCRRRLVELAAQEAQEGARRR